MNAKALGALWLRDHALELESQADRAERAYKLSPLRDVCKYVADKYREAAVMLEEAAIELEDKPASGEGGGA